MRSAGEEPAADRAAGPGREGRRRLVPERAWSGDGPGISTDPAHADDGVHGHIPAVAFDELGEEVLRRLLLERELLAVGQPSQAQPPHASMMGHGPSVRGRFLFPGTCAPSAPGFMRLRSPTRLSPLAAAWRPPPFPPRAAALALPRRIGLLVAVVLRGHGCSRSGVPRGLASSWFVRVKDTMRPFSPRFAHGGNPPL